jgi:hypothetical protein
VSEFKPGIPLRPPRVNLQVPVRYRVRGEERWSVGRTENISRTGVLIRITRVLSLNSVVEAVMKVPPGVLADRGGEVLFMGAVARVVPQPPTGGLPGIGIVFQSHHFTHD